MKRIEDTEIYKFLLTNTNLKPSKDNKFIFYLNGMVVLELLLNKRLGRVMDVKLRLSKTTYIKVEKFMDMINFISHLRFKKMQIKNNKYFIGTDNINCIFIHENKWVKSSYNYIPPPILILSLTPTPQNKKVKTISADTSIERTFSNRHHWLDGGFLCM